MVIDLTVLSLYAVIHSRVALARKSTSLISPEYPSGMDRLLKAG
jgi:hypothetical protein